MMPFMLMPHRYNQSGGLPRATFKATIPDSRLMVNPKELPNLRALRAYARLHAALHAVLNRRFLLR